MEPAVEDLSQTRLCRLADSPKWPFVDADLRRQNQRLIEKKQLFYWTYNANVVKSGVYANMPEGSFEAFDAV